MTKRKLDDGGRIPESQLTVSYVDVSSCPLTQGFDPEFPIFFVQLLW